MEEPKCDILYEHMNCEKKRKLISAAREIYESMNNNKINSWRSATIALRDRIKEVFDFNEKGWHIIIGHKFGFFCTHEVYNALHFKLDHVEFLVFKHG
ncbi:dynein light chain, putative [Plasmodium ovale wallikeri]|uniref:Dynein light chain, putative n=3 Tax=Plasmodium ovale TaxID=36330 RepID=A0A1A8VPS6_PLAOA|nr:dynein light chain, putative [Plasmodium ovale curtisi]SBT30860.1 dynein light chain, putative [Plasmodium ovale wallikeri]SBT75376.1 dynein light chain, putative [Plasmodium ovale]SBS80796.1 dynein light chain, putative [Plasmodium ovale curtisi]SBT31473.1 dynein light chain, putative [Plasmodium ovale wallikeri]